MKYFDFWSHLEKRPGTVIFRLCDRYLYNSMRLRFYIFGLLPDWSLCYYHCHGWVYCIVITKIRLKGLCGIVWFWIILFESLYLFMLHWHTETNNKTILFVITIVTGEFTILIIQKYGFKVCVISFGFYSTCYKVYIIYPASTHSDKQQHHSTSLLSYHLATTKRQFCIRGQPIVVR